MRRAVAALLVALLLPGACQGSGAPGPEGTSPAEPETVPAATATAPTAPAYQGRIVYAASDGTVRSVAPDGAGQLIIARPDGGGEGGGFKGAYTWPVWSPDASAVLLSKIVPQGGRRLQAALVRASAGGGQEPLVIYRDDPGTYGIGTGVPHYALWSPDGSRVALVAGGGSGLFTVFVDPAAQQLPDVFVGGEPMFLAWAPSSRHLLVHHGESLRLVEFSDGGGRSGGSLGVGEDSFDYLAPQFAPDGDRFVYAEPNEGGSLVRIGRLGESVPGALTEARGQIAFRWSPDSSRIAMVEGEDQRIFERLTVVDVSTGERTVLVDRPMHSFWWSPDGERIAVASLAGGGLEALAWSVVDVASGREVELGLNVPTDEFQFMQTFFDQYAHSHDIWSPDSRAIVVFGTMLDATLPLVTDSPEVASHTWVLDASGELGPVAVGEGYIGAWSPR